MWLFASAACSPENRLKGRDEPESLDDSAAGDADTDEPGDDSGGTGDADTADTADTVDTGTPDTDTPLPGDWTNNGGNAGRNGLVDVVGPTSERLLWTGGRSSAVGWTTVIHGGAVYTVRAGGFEVREGASPVVAMDVATVSRGCTQTGSCGAAMGAGDALYTIEYGRQGYAVVRRDASTGALRYASDDVLNLNGQMTPMVAPDGTVVV